MEKMLAVKIWRGEEDGEFVTYQVPSRENQTVLDVVTEIQRQVDPTLAYRFSCRVGVCGSCAMTVNGKPRWTCRSHVKNVVKNNTIVLEPLRNMPRIKDLVVDMTEFFDKWKKAGGEFIGTRTRHDSLRWWILPAKPENRRMRRSNASTARCVMRLVM